MEQSVEVKEVEVNGVTYISTDYHISEYEKAMEYGHTQGKARGYVKGYNKGFEDGKIVEGRNLNKVTDLQERERQLQEEAWDKGYNSAIEDYLTQGDDFLGNKGCYEFGDCEHNPNKETQEAMQEVLDGVFVIDTKSDDKTKEDLVNNPSHYNSDPSGVKCIEITRQRNNNIGNVFKYLWRNGLKDGNSDIQDLEKGAWYLNDEIQRLKGLNND